MRVQVCGCKDVGHAVSSVYLLLVVHTVVTVAVAVCCCCGGRGASAASNSLPAGDPDRIVKPSQDPAQQVEWDPVELPGRLQGLHLAQHLVDQRRREVVVWVAVAGCLQRSIVLQRDDLVDNLRERLE